MNLMARAGLLTAKAAQPLLECSGLSQADQTASNWLTAPD